MSVASDFVTLYRQHLGTLLQTREKLRALGRVLDSAPKLLEGSEDAFQGSNADLVAGDIKEAKAVLDGLDQAITDDAQGKLYKLAGNAALPK